MTRGILILLNKTREYSRDEVWFLREFRVNAMTRDADNARVCQSPPEIMGTSGLRVRTEKERHSYGRSMQNTGNPRFSTNACICTMVSYAFSTRVCSPPRHNISAVNTLPADIISFLFARSPRAFFDVPQHARVSDSKEKCDLIVRS